MSSFMHSSSSHCHFSHTVHQVIATFHTQSTESFSESTVSTLHPEESPVFTKYDGDHKVITLSKQKCALCERFPNRTVPSEIILLLCEGCVCWHWYYRCFSQCFETVPQPRWGSSVVGKFFLGTFLLSSFFNASLVLCRQSCLFLAVCAIMYLSKQWSGCQCWGC